KTVPAEPKQQAEVAANTTDQLAKEPIAKAPTQAPIQAPIEETPVAVSTAADPADTIVVDDVAYIDLDASEKEDTFLRTMEPTPKDKVTAETVALKMEATVNSKVKSAEATAIEMKSTVVESIAPPKAPLVTETESAPEAAPVIEDLTPTVADTVEEVNAQPAPAAGVAILRDPGEAINHLIALGNEALQRQRLMFPKGNSAYDRFTEVLALSPNNHEAIAGLSQIVDGYLKLASKELNSGSLTEAYDHTARALSLTEKHPLPSAITAEAVNMRKTIDRVHYLEAMKKIETWNSTLRNEASITRENPDAAYQAYRVAKESDYSDSKLDIATELYSNAFFKLGKDYFKEDQLDISKDLIAKGLEINPQHEDLNELNDRWQRKNSGEESFFDKFYW
ncbi:MAG: hypothetical protein MI976_13160, partial [Pseudomonadales bacterium]|nr:hypothetical protein [Pseudomonadales bacterium]